MKYTKKDKKELDGFFTKLKKLRPSFIKGILAGVIIFLLFLLIK